MPATEPFVSEDDPSLETFARVWDLPADLQREAVERVLRTSSGELRQRVIRAAAGLLPDDVLVSYLREESDDVLRNAGLEMLKLRGRRALGTALALLADRDPDVVLQAVLVLDAIRDPRAWTSLRPLLAHDDVNIVQAIVVAAGHLGGASASRDLLPFLSADPWLQIAAIQALGDLRAAAAVPHLRPLLADPFLQDFAAGALARIGDVQAFRTVVSYWLGNEQELDPRFFLELIAGMLSQFERPPREEELLRAAQRYSGSGDWRICAAAAWCVVVLSPRVVPAALDVVAATATDTQCPLPLTGRSDLAAVLIQREPPLRGWGYEILQRYPLAVDASSAASLLRRFPPPALEPVAAYMASNGAAELGVELLSLWLENPSARDTLRPAVHRHARTLWQLLPNLHLAAAESCSLLEAMGAVPVTVAGNIAELGAEERWDAVREIRTRAVIKRLPWAEWIASAASDTAVRALADAVSRTACSELLPLVRQCLGERPLRELIQAAGDLRDRESLPTLVSLLDRASPLLRAVIFDAIGRIGGVHARMTLRAYSEQSPADFAHAVRALALCATTDDHELLRAAATSQDLSVRLAVVNALAAFPDAGNRRVLRRLLFDPSAAVSKKAQAALDLARSGA